MRILILGATGRTGKLVLKKALKKGYLVNVVVRDKTKIKLHSNLKVYEGRTDDGATLSFAAAKCQAIISVLNISRTSDFPWAPLRTPKTFLSDTMKNCLQVVSVLGINRLIICSAWGVAETKSDIPFWFRYLIQYSNIGVAYKDHERQEELLKKSDFDWTIVRPVGLTDSFKPQQIQVSHNNIPKPKLTISRKSVAEFMVSALEDNALIGKSPVISANSK